MELGATQNNFRWDGHHLYVKFAGQPIVDIALA